MTMKNRVKFPGMVFALAMGISASCAEAADKAMIVLDASGSMWAEIGGRAKIDIARKTLGDVLSTLPGDIDLGFMAYGHRDKGSCEDIEEIVPAGPGTRERIAEAARKLNPKGKTPISASVRRAAEALKFTEDKATVILVTDGIETCNADPCAAARELKKQGIDFVTHVVGFGLSKEEGKQVACVAEATGGKYIEAKDAKSLADALRVSIVLPQAPKAVVEAKPKALAKNVKLTAFLAEGAPVAGRDTRWEFFAPGSQEAKFVYYGQAISEFLEPGPWRVVATADLVSASFDIEASATELVERPAILNAGIVEFSVAPDEKAQPVADGLLEAAAGGEIFSGYGNAKIAVPAGRVTLKGHIGPAVATQEIELAAGEIRTVRLVAGAGAVSVSAVYAQGGPAVESGDLFFEVFEAKSALDGTRKSVSSNYGKQVRFPLPAGDYVVLARLSEASAETAVSIKAGERADVVINLNAGVLQVTAPGAYWIEIFGAKKDLQGNRKSIAGQYGEKLQITVAPGEYEAVAVIGKDLNGDRKIVPATVRAAERTEVEAK
jgi:Ca-activated chloride channel family protein